jgi:hypothetical protein
MSATDLETFAYLRMSFPMLPDPVGTGIPFHMQGMPVPDPLQKHPVKPEAMVINSDYSTANTLPLGRFIGTNQNQAHQPHFLGANERIVFESSW